MRPGGNGGDGKAMVSIGELVEKALALAGWGIYRLDRAQGVRVSSALEHNTPEQTDALYRTPKCFEDTSARHGDGIMRASYDCYHLKPIISVVSRMLGVARAISCGYCNAYSQRKAINRQRCLALIILWQHWRWRANCSRRPSSNIWIFTILCRASTLMW